MSLLEKACEKSARLDPSVSVTSEEPKTQSDKLPVSGGSKRYASLDALRGLTIALMILVNNPGSWSHVYGPLRHAPWHGCTLTDLVFPFFLFIVGSAMYFSFSRSDFQFDRAVGLRIAKRTILIFGIGLLLHALSSYTFSSDFRIMGVLQRIALAYAAAALIVLFARQRWIVLSVSAILLLSYWGVLVLFGGESPYALESNAVRLVDQMILGAKRMYSVDGVAFDPEGLLSTIPSIVTVLIGFETARYLKSESNRIRSVVVLACVGIAFIAGGWAWGYIWPVNKALWTGSFVVLTAGWAMLVLSVLVWLMDVCRFKFQPLQAFGLNPLFLYAFSWIWMLSYWLIPVGEGKLFPLVLGFFVAGEEISKASSFLFAISHVGFFWLVAELLYLKRIVIKV